MDKRSKGRSRVDGSWDSMRSDGKKDGVSRIDDVEGANDGV
jgi:hypothetical protein